jgi:5-formyltetrahydrofolate cyclo-ligase
VTANKPMAVLDRKLALRRELRDRLALMTEVARERGARDLCERIGDSREWSAAGVVLMFAPRFDEPDLMPLARQCLEAGKGVGFLRYEPRDGIYSPWRVKDLDSDLAVGHFGIREPRASCEALGWNQLDLVLVPGLGFDLMGGRIGRGKGFFDRLLTLVKGVKCGVAFAEQVCEAIPVEAHDVRMNSLVTPQGWVRFTESQMQGA